MSRASQMARAASVITVLMVAATVRPLPAQPPSDRGQAAREAAYRALAKQVAELERFGRAIESVAKLVSPTVVHIKSRKSASFMHRQFTFQETGSGVLVRLPGKDRPYVLTNHHVIEQVPPDQLIITAWDGRPLHAQRIWSDPKSDVAVLAIAERNVPTCRLGDSDKLAIGHWVLAVGSPFDLTGSVTLGIVSGKSRRALRLGGANRGVINQDFIQTDAAINPGNSGGPLVNLRGEVVGINTAIASQSGGSEGVGFAMPINLVRRIASQLIDKNQVRRAYLGVGLAPPLDAVTGEKLGLPRARGALVEEVFEGTPAKDAGLQPMDVIVEFDGRPVEDRDHLINLTTMAPVGKKVSIVVWRNRKRLTLTAKLGDRQQLEGRPAAAKPGGGQETTAGQVFEPLGITVRPLTEQDRIRFGYPDQQQGLLVLTIRPHSRAAQFLDKFDVIDQVEGQSVRSVDELARRLAGAKLEEGVVVRVVRSSYRGLVRRRVVLGR